MSRKPLGDRWSVITWHKEGLSEADICRKTGHDRRFVARWIERYESGKAVLDEQRSGRPRKLSTRIEQNIERKMRGKRRRSSRVVARELKRQKIAHVSYM
jgi:transposase